MDSLWTIRDVFLKMFTSTERNKTTFMFSLKYDDQLLHFCTLCCLYYLQINSTQSKVIMLGKLFKRCTHLLYCSVLSLVGNVTQDGCHDIESIFHIKINEIFFLLIGNYNVNFRNFKNYMF